MISKINHKMCAKMFLLVYNVVMNKRTFNKAVKVFGSQVRFADYFSYSRQFITNIKRGVRDFPKDRVTELNDILENGLKNDNRADVG